MVKVTNCTSDNDIKYTQSVEVNGHKIALVDNREYTNGKIRAVKVYTTLDSEASEIFSNALEKIATMKKERTPLGRRDEVLAKYTNPEGTISITLCNNGGLYGEMIRSKYSKDDDSYTNYKDCTSFIFMNGHNALEIAKELRI